MGGKTISPDPIASVDWDRIDALTDDDIRRAVAEDPDTVLIEDLKSPRRRVIPAPEVDVREIRRKIGLSQAAFAARFGFTTRAVQNWEQGLRRPGRTARFLLWIIDQHPGAIDDALEALRERAET